MQDKEPEATTMDAETETSGTNEAEASPAADAKTSAEGSAGKAKTKRAADKPRRSHGERAVANIRSAKKGQREVSDPVERARFMLAEANVLALLELADAISGGSGAGADADAASD
jgi:hypothetical protein